MTAIHIADATTGTSPAHRLDSRIDMPRNTPDPRFWPWENAPESPAWPPPSDHCQISASA